MRIALSGAGAAQPDRAAAHLHARVAVPHVQEAIDIPVQ